jgi:hypothetical protein
MKNLPSQCTGECGSSGHSWLPRTWWYGRSPRWPTQPTDAASLRHALAQKKMSVRAAGMRVMSWRRWERSLAAIERSSDRETRSEGDRSKVSSSESRAETSSPGEFAKPGFDWYICNTSVMHWWNLGNTQALYPVNWVLITSFARRVLRSSILPSTSARLLSGKIDILLS